MLIASATNGKLSMDERALIGGGGLGEQAPVVKYLTIKDYMRRVKAIKMILGQSGRTELFKHDD